MCAIISQSLSLSLLLPTITSLSITIQSEASITATRITAHCINTALCTTGYVFGTFIDIYNHIIYNVITKVI